MQTLHLPSLLGLRPLRFAIWNDDKAFVFPHLLHFLLPLASSASRLAVRCAEVLRSIAWQVLHLALRFHLPCECLLNRDSGSAVKQPIHTFVLLGTYQPLSCLVTQL
jgi:hypothetical protein